MKDARFAEYHEAYLSRHSCSNGGERYTAIERLAWQLHKDYPPAGSIVLGDKLLSNRISFVDRNLDAVGIAKEILSGAFKELESSETRDGWDEYYLAVCYSFGRGTAQCSKKAATHYFQAAALGNRYAEFEAIWSDYLSGRPGWFAAEQLRHVHGPLEKYAILSSNAIALVELGPSMEPGSQEHLTRVLELSSLLRRFLYHDQGARLLRTRITKELASDVERIATLESLRSYLILYLLAKNSPRNTTGAAPIEWFRKCIKPGFDDLLLLCEAEMLDEADLELIVTVADEDGWADKEPAVTAKRILDGFYD